MVDIGSVDVIVRGTTPLTGATQVTAASGAVGPVQNRMLNRHVSVQLRRDRRYLKLYLPLPDNFIPQTSVWPES
jgi:hypothetical protein